MASIHLRDRDDDGLPRLAVVASRKVGKAAARNRAKRLLREAARQRSWPRGVDVVLIARPSCATSNLAEVLADLDEQLS